MRREDLEVLYNPASIKKFGKEIYRTFKLIEDRDNTFKVGDSTEFISSIIGNYKDMIWTPVPDASFLDVGIKLQKGNMVNSEYVESIVLDVKGAFKDINDNSDTRGIINTRGRGKLIKVTIKTATEEIGALEADAFKLKNSIATVQKGFNLVYREEIDRAGYLGVGNQKGLITQSFSSNNTNDSGKTLDTMTNTELISFLHDVVMTQRSEAGSRELWANKLIVPPNVYNRIVMSDYKTYTDKTIAVKLREDSQIDIVSSYLLGKDYNGLDSANPYDIVIAQVTNPNIVNFVLPRGLTFTPSIKNHFGVEIGAYYAIAGLDFFIEEASGIGNFK